MPWRYQTTGLYFHCKTNLRVLLHSVGSLLPEALQPSNQCRGKQPALWKGTTSVRLASLKCFRSWSGLLWKIGEQLHASQCYIRSTQMSFQSPSQRNSSLSPWSLGIKDQSPEVKDQTSMSTFLPEQKYIRTASSLGPSVNGINYQPT